MEVPELADFEDGVADEGDVPDFNNTEDGIINEEEAVNNDDTNQGNDFNDYIPEDLQEYENQFEERDNTESEDVNEENSSEKEQKLNRKEIIELTNARREKNGLKELSENSSLNLAAQKKAEDMFERQYFAHTSPTGEEAADLVEEFDYSYILVGENLAKGTFQSNYDLIEGWMNSPDHRENILKEGYEEIGIGIKKDIYEGQEMWMAVQIFGTSSSSCPEPDSYLLKTIEKTEESLDDLKTEIEEIDENIDTYSGSEYSREIEKRNELADQYNYLREQLQTLIAEYNKQVEKRNDCVENY
ncbi:MAG: CAP domain-containing protein [Patescibacteria group bacterium]